MFKKKKKILIEFSETHFDLDASKFGTNENFRSRN